MSTWDNLRESVNRWTNKINSAAEDIADQTALQFKLTSRRSDLDKEYTALGKLTYQKLNPTALPEATESGSEHVPDALTEQINQSMARISAIQAEIEELEKRVK
ncbi:MAG: hypothetical protein IJW40_08660 [Clostridia bacterium]|nr:hypothetical protein [Clostridia bacterium]